jgi:hypothetical protein
LLLNFSGDYETIPDMAKRYYTVEQIRAALKQKMNGKTQADVAAEIGVAPQQVSATLKGFAPATKVLTWLGYKRVEGLYERNR